ncbi:MAG: hypothetical protein N2504_04205 [candidate division WOR-3 bacterium]|nr:hypothetical protein [candidate division WOR-3 bacterium]MCX7947771.1 hypothetical protein [candidate division WOR-3 bacterium]MDW8150305.1 hypothetical protein [candidate division WOR-3 bacterium]
MILLNIGFLWYMFYRFEAEKKKSIQSIEIERQEMVYSIGYLIGLLSRNKMLSEAFPDNLRSYFNELVRNDRNLNLILVADSSGRILLSTNVKYEGMNLDSAFFEEITSLTNYEIKQKGNLIVLNMPISEFNKKLLYVRVEYKRR